VAVVTRWGFRYRAHNGMPRLAVLLLPAQYGPRNPPPPLPFVISPHGRGIRGVENATWWRNLPGRGDFAVVCPGGMGRRLPLHSWGWRGQIDDLARMPDLAVKAKRWLRIDRKRIYAIGGSMGGQETLLLIARHPQILAGAAAFDSVTNLYTRYRDFAQIANGRRLQLLARTEVGGTPAANPDAYVQRSPIHFVAAIARAGVPFQLWWSDKDEIVTGQKNQSGEFFRELEALHPRAPVEPVRGSWSHTAETYSNLELPRACERLGLIPV
jgi:poly(3-hydroxybutyrate) depolymerase